MEHSMRTMTRTIALAFVLLGLASAPLAAQANPPLPSNPPGEQPTGPQYQGPPPKLRRLNHRNRKARSTPRMKSSMPVNAFSARFRVSSRRSSRRRAANSGSPTVTCSARKAAARWLRDCATGKASSTPRMPVTSGCFGKDRHLAMTSAVEGARTMMLVYNLPATDAIYQRFAGIGGSAYFVGGLGMTALTMNNIVVV